MLQSEPTRHTPLDHRLEGKPPLGQQLRHRLDPIHPQPRLHPDRIHLDPAPNVARRHTGTAQQRHLQTGYVGRIALSRRQRPRRTLDRTPGRHKPDLPPNPLVNPHRTGLQRHRQRLDRRRLRRIQGRLQIHRNRRTAQCRNRPTRRHRPHPRTPLARHLARPLVANTLPVHQVRPPQQPIQLRQHPRIRTIRTVGPRQQTLHRPARPTIRRLRRTLT